MTALGVPNCVEDGGVTFRGSLEVVARANLWLRTGSRVLVRVASFRAEAFHELERLARAVPWERFLSAGAAVRFRVTSRRSKLYHTGGITQRLVDAVEHRLGTAPSSPPVGLSPPSRAGAPPGDATNEEAGDTDVQLFVVRVDGDRVTVSADSSGALLHLRGYRQAIAKAPLRETIAAAMLLERGWTGATPLLDPLCGSGTIPLEGALIARRIAPGLRRGFRFLDWPELDRAMWRRVIEHAHSVTLKSASVPIQGSDRDEGAITAARANAERAEVGADVEFSVRPLSAMAPASGERGLVAVNPPYGVRVGEVGKLRDLYARLGAVIRERLPEWELSLLSANARLDAQLRLPLVERLRTRNGGIPVRLLSAQVPATAG